MSKKTLVRLGLVCAIGFGLWRLWENDAVINAVILFSTAGVVPGTDIVLTPEQVYIVLGAILLLSIFVIFAKEIKRDVRAVRAAWRHWRERGGGLAAAEAVTEEIVAEAEVEARNTSRRSRKAAKLAVAQATLPVAAVAAAATGERPAVVIAVQQGPGRWQLLWRMVRPRLIIAVGATLEMIIKAADHSVVWASRATMLAYGKCVQAWLWVEPYLRRFDARIEHTLKGNKDIAAMLHLWSELLKLMNARIAELRARFTRIPRAPEE
jgi:hypothetical protein